MTAEWLLLILVFGVNYTIWGGIGLLRLADRVADRLRDAWFDGPRAAGSAAHLRLRRTVVARLATGPLVPLNHPARRGVLLLENVAVLMAAHNEEVVIDDSLRAITALIPASQVHVVSDFSSDRTVEIARARGVNVIETPTNVGKAGALEEGIRRFALADHYEVVLLLDADTRLDPQYFTHALPMFDDPRVVAVAGNAQSHWREGLTWTGRMLTAHRSRIYYLTQRLLKFGQTWRFTNATHIVPGFASLYRTRVLRHIRIDAPGLVIEDFNMTFSVYRHKLGRVSFTPGAAAVTQDPDTLHDYVKQTKRWALGLWQTVRRHGFRADLLSVVVALLLAELITASVFFLLLPLLVLTMLVPVVAPPVLGFEPVAAFYGALDGYVTWRSLALGVVLPDLLLTTVVAVCERRWRYALYAPAFLVMRVIDAGIALYSLPRAWLETSTGRWTSPARRDPTAGRDLVVDVRDHVVAPGAAEPTTGGLLVHAGRGDHPGPRTGGDVGSLDELPVHPVGLTVEFTEPEAAVERR